MAPYGSDVPSANTVLGRDSTPGVSRTLIDAIIRDADRILIDSEVGDAVDRTPTRRALLFALGGPIYAGTNEIQRNIIAERLLGLPREKTR